MSKDETSPDGTSITAQIAEVAKTLTEFKTQTERAVEQLFNRIVALEDRDDNVISMPSRTPVKNPGDLRPSIPPVKLCEFCGAVSGVHFDDCPEYVPPRSAA